MHLNSNFPTGCRPADLERAESRISDLSPQQLWRLLDEKRQADLYRRFFHRNWAELAVLLEEPAQADRAMQSLWLTWRDDVVNQMAMAGEIRLDDGGRRPC